MARNRGCFKLFSEFDRTQGLRPNWNVGVECRNNRFWGNGKMVYWENRLDIEVGTRYRPDFNQSFKGAAIAISEFGDAFTDIFSRSAK